MAEKIFMLKFKNKQELWNVKNIIKLKKHY